MPGDDELAVRIVCKAYRDGAGGRLEVLRDIAFAGQPGEILALLGRSGSGKTTLLRAVLGLDRAFEGKVAAPRGRRGVMFQEPRLLPWLSVGANLRLVAADAAADIPGLLAALGLAGSEDRLPRTLSLGMARRVALARALLGRPRMLVLDEPFASLDPDSAAAVARLLRRAARRDRTLVLLSTHGLDPVLGIADRLLLLAGTPARLVADCPTRALAEPTDAAVGDMRHQLLSRFPFLRGESAPEAAS